MPEFLIILYLAFTSTTCVFWMLGAFLQYREDKEQAALRKELEILPEQPIEILACEECRGSPFEEAIPQCGRCRHNSKMAALSNVQFMNYPSEVGYGQTTK